MPVALRVALLLWPHRRRLALAIVLTAVTLVMVPVVLALALVGAQAGPNPPGGAPVAPMDTWVMTQRFGCTGVSVEPPSAGCPHFHTGVDLAAPAGTPVHAVLGGTVAVVGEAGGYGRHVIVASGARLAVLYAHLGLVAVADGAGVMAGGLIGYEGSTGLSTGPHLHLEVRQDGRAVDPERFLPDLFAHPPAGRAALATPAGPITNKGDT
ncbi:MAG TPA: M23 family metallopeptidase [Candidatus Dormibacteraeota bacterium]|jgi:murein DD-endopeptidase MepM/ murein hydrolase activator NlpD|nr:M23 family metallopeptidase [Candidatus Dormibacteraeota bacterium]